MREDVLAAILSADKDLSRDEPEVAANIGKQLEHMGLSTWSISVREESDYYEGDAIARLQPNSIIQTGDSPIGNRPFDGMDFRLLRRP